ncbi:MAG: hypothetical protein V1743_04560 [Nanoarchaeota archaeon]
METIQLNIRIAKELMFDLEFISQSYHLNKAEWLKVKMAEMIRQAKNDIIISTEQAYAEGKIDRKEFEKVLRYPPSEFLEIRKRELLHEKIAEENEKKLLGEQTFKYFQELIQKTKDEQEKKSPKRKK